MKKVGAFVEVINIASRWNEIVSVAFYFCTVGSLESLQTKYEQWWLLFSQGEECYWEDYRFLEGIHW